MNSAYMKLHLRYIVLSLTLAAIIDSASIYAQEKRPISAFSEVTLGANFVWNGSSGDLDEYWNSGSGIDGYIQTPFYAGNIKLSFTYMPFKGRDINHPDFNSYYINLGWNENISLVNRLSLYLGVSIGSFLMSFDDETLTEFKTQESEIGAAAEAGLKFSVTPALYFQISTDFLSVFTSRRIKLFNMFAGVSYAFTSPKWFRELAE
jgi:hypothetical protein